MRGTKVMQSKFIKTVHWKKGIYIYIQGCHLGLLNSLWLSTCSGQTRSILKMLQHVIRMPPVFPTSCRSRYTPPSVPGMNTKTADETIHESFKAVASVRPEAAQHQSIAYLVCGLFAMGCHGLPHPTQVESGIQVHAINMHRYRYKSYI